MCRRGNIVVYIWLVVGGPLMKRTVPVACSAFCSALRVLSQTLLRYLDLGLHRL
jgi:hypothetical protein